MQKWATAFLAICLVGGVTGGTMEEDFANPPVKNRPHVWWHWLGNSVTREGIVRDLRAMREAGIGGATIFTIASQAGGQAVSNAVNGSMSYQNETWWDMVACAAEEAARNGIELGMHNCPGFSVSGGPWIQPEMGMKHVVWTEKRVQGGTPLSLVLKQPNAKFSFYRDIAVLAVPAGEPDVDAVLDLSSAMGTDGRLVWTPPAGEWTIYRMGYTPTGKSPHPVPEEIRESSLEADKLSAKAMNFHLEHVIPPLRKRLGRHFGKSFAHLLQDSYEAGNQNWTEGFRESFRTRRGYDLVRWLPTLAGRKIGGVAFSTRFKEDFDQTVQELFTENNYKVFHRWTSEAGLQLQIEPYGGPFDPYEAAALADIPMVEFWGFRTFWMSEKQKGGYPSVAGAVGRALGRGVIATEAFTGMPTDTGWCESPRDFKNSGDATFARGINRMTLHHWVHQPFAPNLRPGMTMGFWGSHFGQCQTWHEPGKSFYAYLGRCQALLQRGEQVVDVLALKCRPKASEFDAIPESIFLRDLTVDANGRLVLPSGRRYLLLRLPAEKAMSPLVARKVKDLVAAGATVWGPRPQRATGLSSHQEADAEIRRIADEVWGGETSRTGEHSYGKGKILWGGTQEKILEECGVPSGFQVFNGDPDEDILCSHRMADGIPYFFVANKGTNTLFVQTAFRVTGRVPEFWHAENLKKEDAVAWMEKNNRTWMTLEFRPNQSFFVVFRRSSAKEDPIVKTGRPGAKSLTIDKAIYRAKDTGESVDITEVIRSRVGIRSLHLFVNNTQLGGDPFPNRYKQLELTYTLNGKKVTRVLHERDRLILPEGQPEDQPVFFIRNAEGEPIASGTSIPDGYVAWTRSGREIPIAGRKETAPLALTGPWQVTFAPGYGAPASITLDALRPLNESEIPGVRYFSGTATYTKEFEMTAGSLRKEDRVMLDLGDVREMAEVRLNGHPLGVLWYPPFCMEVTGFLREGKNKLEARVTNTWANRMIGDHREPEDCQWGRARENKRGYSGRGLCVIPDWAIRNTPRPSTGRYTFCMWDYFKADTKLRPSGLIGPVRITRETCVPLGK